VIERAFAAKQEPNPLNKNDPGLPGFFQGRIIGGRGFIFGGCIKGEKMGPERIKTVEFSSFSRLEKTRCSEISRVG